MLHKTIFRGERFWRVTALLKDSDYEILSNASVYPEREYLLTIEPDTKRAVIENIGMLMGSSYFEWDDFEDLFL